MAACSSPFGTRREGQSTTQGDWVGVGRHLRTTSSQERDGQYRVRLMDNHHRWDCAYPGVEVLPDGTFVTTTYGHWRKGEKPYVVSVRFTLAELDAKVAGARQGRRRRSMSAEDFRLRGLIAATFAPLADDGEVDTALVPPVVDALVGDGVAGLYVSGTTGEGESLTAAERCAIAAAYVEAAGARIPVLVQVGHNSYAQAREMAAHARSVGAAGISALAPSYFKPTSVSALVEHLARIAEGAPDLPLYYYHLPRFTGVDFDMAELLEVGGERIANLRGIKYSVPDVIGFRRCAALSDGHYDLVWGCDEMLLTGLCAGARAAIAAPTTLRRRCISACSTRTSPATCAAQRPRRRARSISCGCCSGDARCRRSKRR